MNELFNAQNRIVRDGKEAHYVQTNQIIGAITEGKKLAEETIKKAEMDTMMDLKNLIAKSARDADLNRIKMALIEKIVAWHRKTTGHTLETFHQSGDYTF